MPKKHQNVARVMAAPRRAFRAADIAVFGALVIAALLVAVGIAHSGLETMAMKADRAPVTASAGAVTAAGSVTRASTDPETGTTTLTRMPVGPDLL